MIKDLRRILYSEETLALLGGLIGTIPNRVFMDSAWFQFEYRDRILVTGWEIEGPTPGIGWDELSYIVPQWYPDQIDSFPGFDHAVVVAQDEPVTAISVVRSVIWSDGEVTPRRADNVDAIVAYMLDLGFLAVVGGKELACFANGTNFLCRETDILDETTRQSLEGRYQFLTLEEARPSS